MKETKGEIIKSKCFAYTYILYFDPENDFFIF